MKYSSIKLVTADSSGVSGATLLYANKDALPTGSQYEGTLAFSQDSDRLYLHTGLGWFNVAIINTVPYLTSSPAAAYELSNDATGYNNGTATVITLAATDSEGMALNWSYVADSNMTSIAYISNDSGVYTIEPRSQDSVGQPNQSQPTGGTLTFKVSDGVNIASAVSTFSLTFISTVYQNRQTDATITGNTQTTTAGVLHKDKFKDYSSNNLELRGTYDANVATGRSPLKTNFSPYRDAGYSWLVNASSNARLKIQPSSDLQFTGDFTLEFWFCMRKDSSASWHDLWDYGSSTTFSVEMNNSGSIGGGGIPTGGPYMDPHTGWCHHAWVRNGSNIYYYVNGVQYASTSNSSTWGSATEPLAFGYRNEATEGFFYDIRVSNVARYTADFAVPTKKFTNDSNTQLLTARNAHLLDESDNKLYVGFGGNYSASAGRATPFTPYDGIEYVNDDNGGSLYFNNERLIQIDHATKDVSLGAGDFTIEWWQYPRNREGSWQAAINKYYLSTGGFRWYKYQSGVSYGYLYLSGGSPHAWDTTNGGSNNTSQVGTGSTHYYARDPFQNNRWAHCALTRSSNVMRFWVNGVKVGEEASYTTDLTTSSGQPWEIGEGLHSSSYPYQGYLADIRIIVGTCAYTGDFTPPSAPLTTTGGTYPSTTNVNTAITASHTKMLINTKDTPFIDTAQGYGYEPIGDFTMWPGRNKFGDNRNAVYFDGSGDYLSFTASAVVGTADYTLEFWVMFEDLSSDQMIFSMGNYDPAYYYRATSSTNRFAIYDGGAGAVGDSNLDKPQILRWYHVAYVRTSGNLKIYIDGHLRQDHGSSFNDDLDETTMYIGYDSSAYFKGWVSNLRLVKGSAVYSANFTPPTSNLSPVTGSGIQTEILTCQGSSITDASGRSASITTHGNAAVAYADPFAATSSMYFNGTNAYLKSIMSFENEYQFGLPSYGDGHTRWKEWSVEFWVYIESDPATPSSDNDFDGIFVVGSSSAVNFGIGIINTRKIRLMWNTSNATDSNTAVALNTWTHVAVNCKGKHVTMFIGGNLDSTTATMSAISENTSSSFIGHNPDAGKYFDGYLQDLRIRRDGGRPLDNIRGQTLTAGNSATAVGIGTASNVKLIACHAAATTTDGSGNSVSITANGNPTVTNAAPGPDMKSVLFDNSGDYLSLTLPSGGFGSGDFCVEMWIHLKGLSNYDTFFATTRGATGFNIGTDADGDLVWYDEVSSAARKIECAEALKDRTKMWHHIAFVRKSGVIYGLMDGSIIGKYTQAANFSATGCWIGSRDGGNETMDGYISNLRVVVGESVYNPTVLAIGSGIKG